MEDLHKIDIRHLRYFVAMARLGAVTKAAYSLRVSPPSFGRQVRDLESRLGVALFDRTDRKYTLTTCGSYYLNQAESLIDEWDFMFQQLQSKWYRSSSRPIIALPEYIATSDLLTELYPALKSKVAPDAFPTVCELDREPQLTEIIDRTADLVLTLAAPTDRDMSYAEISQGTVSAILPAGHRLAREESLDLGQLNAELTPILLDPQRFPQLATLDTSLAGERPKTLRPLKVSRTTTALETVSREDAYFVSHGLDYGSNLRTATVSRPIRGCRPQPIYLVWRKEDSSENALTLVEAIASHQSRG